MQPNQASTFPSYSRRAMLQSTASGFGLVAFSALAHTLAAQESAVPPTIAVGKSAAKVLHHAPRAKRVIFLCMNGGPSHVDLFDYKPELEKNSGKPATVGGKKIGPALLGNPHPFSQRGESGLWMSALLPELGKMADELCVVRSMHTDLPNHSQAFLQMHTGSFQFVRPSLGAWTLYGLGSENENLPGFVTINPPSDNGGARNYGSGFLPVHCQGTRIGAPRIPAFYAALLGRDEESGPPLKHLTPPSTTERLQQLQIELITRQNQDLATARPHQPEIEGAIASLELAFRMQGEVPKVLELKDESAATLKQYGIGAGLPTDRFGRQCLMARRMVEAGVRFVEVTAPTSWDHHFLLRETLATSCSLVDLPMRGLLEDLKSRGLLDDTLVIWAGEFGRTPYGQSGSGRDHNHKGYSIWMAGGGVKRGIAYGATDEIGYEAVENPVHLHDFHATILHLLGLDHEQLTFRYGGRDYRLTDVYGRVVSDLFA
ncbi:protein of unknown function DUF1501 [Pirellula staleyi DSM 6068]|uniref:Sulfatase n=1 Tax=Pirellula staleyi (strain ATCC 27377 / DSM 6068 / ICPB 4128) TaxID=530564 RepID=D2QXR6_PIRSD|nr:DUF1501 domain-containing protein [Pirellula staleyi]ADB17993.1 protein of unknown function DUF1501 [Pirellula staleyi DSM 6068]